MTEKPLEYVQEFVYLGGKVVTGGDCDQETRISKPNRAFAMLQSIWRSIGLSIHTRIRTFKSNVLSVLAQSTGRPMLLSN